MLLRNLRSGIWTFCSFLAGVRRATRSRSRAVELEFNDQIPKLLAAESLRRTAMRSEAPGAGSSSSAPDGACDWLESAGNRSCAFSSSPMGISITSRTWPRSNAAFGCPIGCHPATAPMISDRNSFATSVSSSRIEPVTPELLIEATQSHDFLGMSFEVLEVPGICPGSRLFFSRRTSCLSAATSSRGGVGRPLGLAKGTRLLLTGSREKL